MNQANLTLFDEMLSSSLHPSDSLMLLQVFPVNPKSMSLGELYGEYDLSTNEWTDGVLSSIMRAACAGQHFTNI